MMYARLNSEPHEPVYIALGRWASQAPTHLLRVLLWSGLLGAAGVMVIDMVQWYLGLGMLSFAALGGWGLLEHRLAQRPSAPLERLEVVIATLAMVAALTAVLVALFVFIGPAPHF
jgi:hypothetical protein